MHGISLSCKMHDLIDDEDGVRKSVGLHNNPAVGFRKSGELMVCASYLCGRLCF